MTASSIALTPTKSAISLWTDEESRCLRIWSTVWVLLLALFLVCGVALVAASNEEWVTPLHQRLAATAGVLTLIGFLSYLPVALFQSFAGSERERARRNAMTSVIRHGWFQLAADVDKWYQAVFRIPRYPIPVTTVFISFLAMWSFVFFYSGTEIINSLTQDGDLIEIVTIASAGPPVSFGFLGCYFFSVWFLLTRFISGDLGPGVFVHLAIRVWSVALLVIVVTVIFEGLPIAAEPEASSIDYNKVLLAFCFVGGTTPSALLNFVTNQLRRLPLLGEVLGGAPNQLGLDIIAGLNRWKAARLSEEGLDNVQNLAMEDPSKLVVVTQESGLRILDWIDQALLCTYVREEEEYRRLANNGIRTAYDLYIRFRNDGLVDERAEGVDCRVKMPPSSDDTVLAKVLLSIVHHPNFQKIKRMRDEATWAVAYKATGENG